MTDPLYSIAAKHHKVTTSTNKRYLLRAMKEYALWYHREQLRTKTLGDVILLIEHCSKEYKKEADWNVKKNRLHMASTIRMYFTGWRKIKNLIKELNESKNSNKGIYSSIR